MPSTTSLVNQLRCNYPQFIFKPSTAFSWSHDNKTVCYIANSDKFELLLHELAHGILNHTSYLRDIELITMERDAWNKARDLAKENNLFIKDDIIESSLDTYRDWLHSRSACPKCQATGLQTKKYDYICLACNHKWRVNEAKTCALRRYNKIK